VILACTGAKLLDFNIAPRVGDPVRTHCGTPPYQAPDAGLDRWDVSTDLFAVGALLYQLLCDGHHPYPNATPIVDAPVIDPRTIRPSGLPARGLGARHAWLPRLLPPGDLSAAVTVALWHHRHVTSPLERRARTAYEAHRAAHPASLPPWEDMTEQEQHAWRVAVSAAAAQGGGTLTDAPNVRPLVIQIGGQRRTFRTHFTAGREGNLALDDGFTSSHHARFQAAHGQWYLEDLDSTNGTFLNGRRIHLPQLLKKRDKIRIGHTDIIVVSA
jgi:hypothetical protein